MRKEAKNKHIPDIPLPFNKVNTEEEKQNTKNEGDGSGYKSNTVPENVIPLKDFEKFDLLTRVVGNHLRKMQANNKRGVWSCVLSLHKIQ